MCHLFLSCCPIWRLKMANLEDTSYPRTLRQENHFFQFFVCVIHEQVIITPTKKEKISFLLVSQPSGVLSPSVNTTEVCQPCCHNKKAQELVVHEQTQTIAQHIYLPSLGFCFQIWCNIWGMNHNSEFWDNPWSFKPERFLDEQGQLVGPDHPNRRR